MVFCTHKDRNRIIDSLSDISLKPEETDDYLIQRVSLYLRETPPSSRADVNCHQFGMDLINYLRLNPDSKYSDIVRRTLKYLLQPVGSNSLSGNPSVKAFVAGITLREISSEQKQSVLDENDRLSPDEIHIAEEILLNLADNNHEGDIELVDYISNFALSLGDDVAISEVNKFQRNIRKLVQVLSSGDAYTDEQKSWARGGLSYIRLNDDAIADDFGMIGLLDDMYIAAVAVRLIDPVLQSIEDVIHDLLNVWPFLRDLLLVYKDSEYTYSEFALINTAIICPALTKRKSPNRSALILPNSGVTSFIIAYGAALGAAYEAVGSVSDVVSLAKGQKVKVDNNAVAIYDGVEKVCGEKYIRLKQYYINKGKKLEKAYLIRAEQASRMCPAPDDAVPRGEIATTIDSTEIIIGGTEALFHLPIPQQFTNILGRVWLISNVSLIHTLASEVHLYGHPLSGVLPMGHIMRNGDVSRWDTRFGTTECLLTTISDLDLAAEILEEKSLTDNDLIVINLVNSNKSKFASLSLLQSFGARVLCIVEEKDIETISNLEDNKYDFWEWSAEEVEELISKNNITASSAHPFNLNDAAVVQSLLLTPDTKVLTSSYAETAKADLDKIVSHIRNTADDVPVELQEYLDELFDVTFQLIRLPVPLSMILDGSEAVISKLEDLSNKVSLSVYLNEDERTLVATTIQSLHRFALHLDDKNPKSKVITELIGNDDAVRVLMPPRFCIDSNGLQNSLGYSDQLVHWQNIRDDVYDTLIIPYWPGQRRAWDILSCPPCRDMRFVLYTFEDEWFSAFYRKRNKHRQQRARYGHRSNIFNRNHTWSPAATNPPFFYQKGVSDENTLINEHEFRLHERLVHKARREDEGADIETRMIIFRGGAYAFFTFGHEAWSATHLLDDPSGGIDNEEKLLAVKVNEISHGDVLVFLRGTNRDAIRQMADENLPPGTRETAKLWQKSLTSYVNKNGLSVIELQKQLYDEGCKRHVMTLKQWLENDMLIGPRNYAGGALEAIAKVTNDPEFRERMSDCANAISRVWSEHLRASITIAERILLGAGGKINEGLNFESPIDIGDDLVLAQVDFVESEIVKVPLSAVNKFKEDI
ncbi:MAG: DrmE family protein [Candidatus Thiodiazotropha taylori]|nr:DrmE family protein [Candidatus Thiodiazotropha taylori]